MSLSLATLKANTIIQSLNIRYPSEIKIKEIAMERGAFVHERNIDGAEAWLVRKESIAIITVNSKLHEHGRKRFAIAHELGHFELHNDSQLVVICHDEDMFAWNGSKSQEIEANEFASCILMPEAIFSRYIKKEAPDMDRVSELSSEFGTTLTATAIRYVQLSFEPCAVAVSKNGILKWYKKSDSFEFHLKVGEKLSPDTYAFDYYDGIDLPVRPRKVPATGWIAGEIDPDGEIIEHSIALKSYDVVLSLLWIDKEIRRKFQERDDDEPEYDLTDKFSPDGKRRQW
jgi:Zn-dependent peptidase ImmA (M78 family)